MVHFATTRSADSVSHTDFHGAGSEDAWSDGLNRPDSDGCQALEGVEGTHGQACDHSGLDSSG